MRRTSKDKRIVAGSRPTLPQTTSRLASRTSQPVPRKFQEHLELAHKEGLLGGARTKMIRGRMPAALVAEAKNRAGVESDTDLIELALANIAVSDEYADWLLSQRGAVDPELDIEF
jgi:hypothetical protein